jgi:shikimate dehydrogenase
VTAPVRTAGPWPGAATGLLAVLGHPVSHSLSPVLHNAALAAAGLDLAYVAVDVAPRRLDDALAGLAALGFVGCNVTVPHKQAVLAACTTLDAEAEAVGAVNTLVVGPDGLHGTNTDTTGFLAALPSDLATDAALVFGAGGAARAVVFALARRGWDVVVAARRPAQSAAIARDFARVGGVVRGVGLDDLDGAVAAAGMVVNATPLGLHHEVLPPPLMALRADQVAHDLVYNPPDTPFLVAARDRGALAIDGLGMLVGQAAAAFELWTGVAPDTDLMRDAARHVLSSRP